MRHVRWAQGSQKVLDEGVNRDQILTRMKEQGVERSLGAFAAHLLNPFKDSHDQTNDTCPISTRLWKQGLALPLLSEMDKIKVKRVADTLRICIES